MSENKLQGNNNAQAIEAGKGESTGVNLPTSPKRVIIVGLVFIGLFFGGLGYWAATSQLEGAVIAPGDVIVERYRQQVQHRDGGIVQEILVREGDLVEKGQVLISLDGEEIRAQRDMYWARMDSLKARQARLKAEINNADSIIWPPELQRRANLPDAAESMASEEMIFESRRAAKESKIDLLQAQILTQRAMIQGRERQLESIKDTIASLEEEIESKEPLLDEGFLEVTQLLELRRSLNSNRSRLEQLKAEIDHSEQRIQELELEIDELQKSYAEEAAAQLGEVRQSIVDLREQLRPAEDAAQRLDIKAPATGTVVNLEVRTEGGVIQGGQPLMEIVPQESKLIVSARVPPDQIDDVRQGQDSNVRLQAFSRRYTKKVQGEVTYVSADKVEPEQRQQPPHYLAYVELDPKSLKEAIEDPDKLTPGMPAEVYIQTDAKSILDYILSPILNSMDRAFRE
ncbi:MAG: HlyD family type I secretion periplasmic adaptor subunit [Desulfohalobiaceae bacterium]